MNSSRAKDLAQAVALAAITLLAAMYRFTALELKPPHSDEGVNAMAVLRLLSGEGYVYDAGYYHGPVEDLFAAIPMAIGHGSLFALRFPTALAGVLAVPAIALFQRWLGRAGVLAAALALAIAPIEVYFARTAIHETYNVLFNFTTVAAAGWWFATRQRAALVAAMASLALLFATKETTILTCASWAAGLLAFAEVRGGPRAWGQRLRARFWTEASHEWDYVIAFVAAIVVWAALFSTFGTNPMGPLAFFEGFYRWGAVGVEGQGHEKPWSYFPVEILWPYYRVFLAIAAVGWAVALRRGDRFAGFTLIWFLTAVIGYSIIPYKTPWCVLSWSGPIFLAIGFAAREAVAATSVVGCAVAGLGGVLAAGGLALVAAPIAGPNPAAPLGDAWTINLEEYDVPAHPFVYVQTRREITMIVDDVRGLRAAASMSGQPRPVIAFVGLLHPLPYLLRDLTGVTWPWSIDPAPIGAVDALVVDASRSTEFYENVGGAPIVRRYHIREYLDVDLLVRPEVWDTFVARAAEGRVAPPTPDYDPLSFGDRRTAELIAP